MQKKRQPSKPVKLTRPPVIAGCLPILVRRVW